MQNELPPIAPATARVLCHDQYTGYDAEGDPAWMGAEEGARATSWIDQAPGEPRYWFFCVDAGGRIEAQDEHGIGAYAELGQGWETY